jgi:hypothetical protein
MSRRYSHLPADLPDSIIARDKEAAALAERLHVANVEVARLNDEVTTRAAVQADEDAATQAVLTGGSALAVGRPAQDELTKAREAIVVEVDALGRALFQVEDAMRDAFVQLREGDPKQNGQAKLAAARLRYAKARDALLAARAEYVSALAFPAFVDAASRVHGDAHRYPPVRYNDAASDRPVQMPSAPGRGEPGPRVPFAQAVAVITAELDSEEN